MKLNNLSSRQKEALNICGIAFILGIIASITIQYRLEEYLLFSIAVIYLYFMYYWADDLNRWWQDNWFHHKYVKNVFLFFGFWHSWKMFSRPPTCNRNLHAQFEFINEHGNKSNGHLNVNVMNRYENNITSFLGRKMKNQYLLKLLSSTIKADADRAKEVFGKFLKSHLESAIQKTIVSIVLFEETIAFKTWDGQQEDLSDYHQTIFPYARNRTECTKSHYHL